MEQDGSRVVRAEDAAALGRIGDPRARPALAKAVRSDDANLAYAAGNALKKLR
jgi:HEAT repeat protein